MAELFPGQSENEHVYLVIREHWVYLFSRLLIWLLFAAALVAFDHYMPIYLPQAGVAPYSYFVSLFKDLFIIFMCLGVFMTWTMYHLNTQVVTDQRIVDISHETIFSHTISELSVSKIEDVTAQTNGLIGNMFSFGNVYVQTAGREERFTFKNVPYPDKLERLILNIYDARMKQMSPAAAQEIQA